MADAPGSRAEPRGGGRPRSPTRLVTVERVERMTPLLTRITFTGDALAGFGPPRPAAHIKLLFPADGSGWSPDDEAAPRPPRRTYTPRRFDAQARRLEVDFVHHGDGLAAGWAARAKPGQVLFVTGPGGGYDVPADASEIILVADDTALPAAATILEAAPDTCRAIVLAEVAGKSEQRPLSTRANIQPTWLFRESQSSESGASVPGSLLEHAVRNLAASSPTACWWIACEAAAMRRIRNYLLRERRLDPSRVHTRGYWKLGETAYPDHDYGKD